MQKMMVEPREIILDTSSLSKKRVFKALTMLKEATDGKVLWTESGVELDGWRPDRMVFRLIYDVNDDDLALGLKMEYTNEDQHVYKNVPWWVKAIVATRAGL